MSSWSWKAGLAGVAIIAATAFALAQMPSGHTGMHGQMGGGNQDQPTVPPQGGMHSRMMEMMQGGRMHGQQGMHGGMGGRHGMMEQQSGMPGQGAFGAIQQIVEILEADPTTDWSKVNVGALREHLIDMNEVTLHAVATERTRDNGLEIEVTGEGRTLLAIKRMIPAHADELCFGVE